MVGLDGVLPSRRGGGPGIPAPPLRGCGKKLSTKKGAGPAELGDRAALILRCPELEVPVAGTPSQKMDPVATRILSGQPGPLSDFLIHFASLLNVLYYGEWERSGRSKPEPNQGEERIEPLEKSYKNTGTLGPPNLLKTGECCLLIWMRSFVSIYRLGQEIT